MSFGSFGISIDYQRFVRITLCRQIIIALPAVGTHGRTFHHILVNELCEFFGAAVRDEAQSKSARVRYVLLLLSVNGRPPSTHLNGSNNRCFVVNTASFTFCTPAHERLIYFNRNLIANSVALRSHQTGAEFVEQLKRRFVAR